MQSTEFPSRPLHDLDLNLEEETAVQIQSMSDDNESRHERTPRSRNPGRAPIERRVTKTLKKAQSFPFFGSFKRLHSGLKDAFPLRRPCPQPEKLINRRSSIPGAFKARKRRSTIGNLITGIVPSGLSSLVGQDSNDEDDDLWFTSMDDFEPPIYTLESSTLRTSYYLKASICRKNFVLHEYTRSATPSHTSQTRRLVECLTDLEVKRVRRAVGFMEWIRHPNIIKCYGAWETETAFYIVEEYCYRANLYRQIITNKKALTEEHIVLDILRPLLDALIYLHGMGIVHRGVFPENIYFSKTNILRLSGFFYAIDSNKSRPSTRHGPMDYAPPEVLSLPDEALLMSEEDLESLCSSDEGHVCDEKIDVWQIGVLTYELLHGSCPFEAPDKHFSSSLILWADINTYPSGFSPGAISFLSRALEKIPSRRPTMEELASHPWLSTFEENRSSTSPTPIRGQSLWAKVRQKLKLLSIATWWAKSRIAPREDQAKDSISDFSSITDEPDQVTEDTSSSESSQEFKIPANLEVNSILSAGFEVDDFLFENHLP